MRPIYLKPSAPTHDQARQNVPLAAILRAHRMGQDRIWQAIKEMTLKLARHDAEELSSMLLASECLVTYDDVASMVLAEA